MDHTSLASEKIKKVGSLRGVTENSIWVHRSRKSKVRGRLLGSALVLREVSG